ncbi:YadA-like family protein, partial [Lysobacter sp. CA199]|uniref:YadA-like family protein n=1 Tax=Lysobacter sp. CA199 TaxID=3455608 RepID=UPI003F8CFC68
AVGTYSGGNLKTVTDPTTGAINVQLADSPKFGNTVINDGGSGKISGVTAADLSVASTEAVNGSQLFQTNQDVTALDGRVTATEGNLSNINNAIGPTDQAYQDANGRGVRYVRTNDTGSPQSDAFATGQHATAVGWEARASAVDAIAIGESSVANQLSAMAIGSGAQATGEFAIALGDNAQASANFALALGDQTQAGRLAVAVGSSANASGVLGSALGTFATAAGFQSTAVGNEANAAADSSVALGVNSQATHAGSVALGANAVANGATLGTAAYVPPASTYAVAGTAPIGEVSVGAAGSERRLTNVAAGAGDTDAANISQLKAVDSKITSLGQDSLLWDPTANGGAGAYNANHLGAGPNKIVNVAAADLSAASTDAVNGSQLFQTNEDVAALDTRVTTAEGDITNLDNRVTTNEGDITELQNAVGPTDPAYLQQNGRGARYARTNDTGLPEDDAHAQGVGSTAVGYNATSSAADAVAIGRDSQASHAGSVALGANAVADGSTLGNAGYVPPASTYAVAGLAPVGEVSIGATGSERRLTNVAAGAGDTDAANISQLKAVESKVTSLGQDSLLWDPTANGGTGAYNANHLGTGPNKIVNVAPADLSAASTDAVNGSQLFQTNQDVAALDGRVTTNEGDIANLDNRVTTNEGDITNLQNAVGPTDPAYLQQNGRGTRYARTNDTGLVEDDAHAQGVGSTAVGYNATSSAADAVAIGRDSQASHAGSVALGAGSVANGSTLGNAAYLVGGTATGEVNVGNRRVTGVAAGAQDTDAANVGQLKAVATSATQAEQRAVKYDWNDLDADGEIDPGEVDYSKATLAGPVSTDGGVTGGSRITNLAQGDVSATSTDAVNGAQLYGVTGPNDAAYVAQNGRGLRYARSNDTGLAEADAHAQGVGSSAIGYNATASTENAVAVGRDSVAGHANSVALGAGSSTTVGAQSGYNAAYVGSSNSTGQVQVGGRTIGGVAAGSAADDAVNVAQLQAGVNDAVTQANSYTDTRVDQIAGNVAQYDNRITAVEGDVNNVKNGSAGLFQVSQDNTVAPTASGSNAAAGGAGAVASGTGSTALGNGAIASAGNAVALGAGSVANQEGTVSVGSAGSERRVTNVAAGTADTDAVNVSQLKGFTTGGLQYDKNADGSNNTNSLTLNPNGTGQTTLHNVAAGTAATDAVNVGQLKSGMSDAVVQANSYTDGQVANVRNDVWNLKGDIRRLERDMQSGIATAIAIKPAPYVAGRTTYYAGFGAYKSEAAFGVSLRHTSDSGRWSLEGGASTNSDGIGAYVGVSGVLGD